MKYLVTVNRNIKFSTQVSVNAPTQEAAESLALVSVEHLAVEGMEHGSVGDWDVNDDTGEFVSYSEESHS